jgi:hypothetical protein
MQETAGPEIAPVIIGQNAQEEFRLTMVQCHGRKCVDLRTCIRNQGSGKASPTGKGIAVDLELWPQFRVAVSSPETWTSHVPFGSQQGNPQVARGRLIFPEISLQKTRQEQIFLEHKNFQGIPFIFLKTLPRAAQDRCLTTVTIGPLLWSQFMAALDKMEEILIGCGWLAGVAVPSESPLVLPLPPKRFITWEVAE